MNRIGIFQYEWPLQVHTVNLADRLAKNGYSVDLFLYGCHTEYANLEEIRNNERIVIHEYRQKPLLPVYKRISNRGKTIIGRLLPRSIFNVVDTDIIAPHVLADSTDIASKSNYNYFIGIEKKGLIWAGTIAAASGVPCIYYSLELYIEDHPGLIKDQQFFAVREAEKKYHTSSKATIVQDAMRAEVLLESNGVEGSNLIFFPISVAGGRNEVKGNYFRHRFGIAPEKKIILYFGLITKDRYCFELADASNNLGDDCMMVFHGNGREDDIAIVRGKGAKRGVIISRERIPAHMVKDIVSSADIGLALYAADCANDRLTAFSSEKIALYLQSGLPFIAFDNDNYRTLMRAYRCGELIIDISQLPRAVNTILERYDYYRQNAFSAYEAFYSYDNNFRRLKEYLEKNSPSEQKTGHDRRDGRFLQRGTNQ